MFIRLVDLATITIRTCEFRTAYRAVQRFRGVQPGNGESTTFTMYGDFAQNDDGDGARRAAPLTAWRITDKYG